MFGIFEYRLIVSEKKIKRKKVIGMFLTIVMGVDLNNSRK